MPKHDFNIDFSPYWSLHARIAPLQHLINPYNAEATFAQAQGCKDLQKPPKPCHYGIHWIALSEHSQMSTHLPGFQSFVRFLHHFVLAKLAISSIRVKEMRQTEYVTKSVYDLVLNSY